MSDPLDLLARVRLLAEAVVTSDPERCVQCGICSYNCPIGIDVRSHARVGAVIVDQRCISCGECIARCPRDVLWFGPVEDAAEDLP
ncbi:MAG: 4Fe-4S binding protein [Deltaproteobacteria bacterium]|nr:4Fe-4S binding protein [Deltaproteobacteria bacterium]